MNKITYKEMSVNRPVVVQRGWPGEIEVNVINGYVGEWVVFKLPMDETETTFAELRMPVDLALEQGLIVSSDKIQFYPEDYEE